MSHIVAIFRSSHTDNIPFGTVTDDGQFSWRPDYGVTQDLAERGQHVDRLPEVGECILVAPPEPPPDIDWWLACDTYGNVGRYYTRDVAAREANRSAFDGRIGRIWRENGQLHEQWERVK